MTWQEELRKLDEDFSAGRLTADQYRERRDQVLSSAVTQQPPQQGQKHDETTQVFAKDAAQQPQSPEQPEQPAQPAPQPDSPEATGTGDEAEQTQAVAPVQPQASPPGGFSQQPASPPGGFPQQPASPPGGFPQQPASPAAGFPQQYPPSPAGGFPQQPAAPGGYPQQPAQQPPPPAWHTAEADASPPWGGEEFPPIAPTTDQSWLRPGQEDWSDTDGTSGSSKVAVSAVVIVLIAGLTVGAWWLWFRGEEASPTPAVAANETSQTTTEAPPTTTTTSTLPAPPPAKAEPKSNAKALVTPPGKERLGGGTFDLKQAKKDTLLPSSMLGELTAAKMDDGLLLTTTAGKSTMGLFAIEVKKEKLIGEVADAYAKAQEDGGLPLDDSLSMQGVRVYSAPDSSKEAVFRAVYILHSRVIIVETFGDDRAEVQRQFWSLLRDQVDHAPPTVRRP